KKFSLVFCIRLILNIWILLWDRACMTLRPNTPVNQLRIKTSIRYELLVFLDIAFKEYRDIAISNCQGATGGQFLY
ncbi:hypothetical protein XELAEV_18014405mg, partial [Xenopus laevis]